MLLLRTVGWVLSHLLRDPLIWLWVVLAAALWPTVAALAPVGLTTSQRPVGGPLYEIAFWSLLVGTAAGLGVMGRGAWFLSPLPALRRLWIELTGLATAGGIFLVAAMGSAGLLGTPAPADLWLGAALALVHLTALGVLLLRAPLSAPPRVAALILFAWLVPALLEGAGTVGAALARIFAVSGHLAFTADTDPAQAHRLAAIVPILGLLIAAGLAPPTHALRRPR